MRACPAGNKPSVASNFEMVIDIQVPPNGEAAVLRTWAIETKTGDDQKEYFNNIQLTFEVDEQRARALLVKSKTITREDIRLLLQDQSSLLSRITVSNEIRDGGRKYARGQRYDFTVAELSQRQDDITQISDLLQTVLQHHKQSLADK